MPDIDLLECFYKALGFKFWLRKRWVQQMIARVKAGKATPDDDRWIVDMREAIKKAVV